MKKQVSFYAKLSFGIFPSLAILSNKAYTQDKLIKNDGTIIDCKIKQSNSDRYLVEIDGKMKEIPVQNITKAEYSNLKNSDGSGTSKSDSKSLGSGPINSTGNSSALNESSSENSSYGQGNNIGNGIGISSAENNSSEGTSISGIGSSDVNNRSLAMGNTAVKNTSSSVTAVKRDHNSSKSLGLGISGKFDHNSSDNKVDLGSASFDLENVEIRNGKLEIVGTKSQWYWIATFDNGNTTDKTPYAVNDIKAGKYVWKYTVGEKIYSSTFTIIPGKSIKVEINDKFLINQ